MGFFSAVARTDRRSLRTCRVGWDACRGCRARRNGSAIQTSWQIPGTCGIGAVVFLARCSVHRDFGIGDHAPVGSGALVRVNASMIDTTSPDDKAAGDGSDDVGRQRRVLAAGRASLGMAILGCIALYGGSLALQGLSHEPSSSRAALQSVNAIVVVVWVLLHFSSATVGAVVIRSPFKGQSAGYAGFVTSVAHLGLAAFVGGALAIGRHLISSG